MMQFTLFKTSKEYYSLIIDVFKMLVGNAIDVNYYDNYVVIYHNEFDKHEIESMFKSLEEDLNVNICLYQSYLSEKSDLFKEFNAIIPVFSKMEFGCYNLKRLLLEAKVDKSLDILHFIVDGTGVDERIIEMMALADLNVSKAAGLLYLHRNSLNYKLDRLYETKGFDLKKFIDCYALYRLL